MKAKDLMCACKYMCVEFNIQYTCIATSDMQGLFGASLSEKGIVVLEYM
jgi:hypothetical protein